MSSAPWCRSELGEHRAHVGLHRLRTQVKPLADRLVGTAFRHHRQHLTFAVGQRVEWIARSSAPDQLGHNRRIDHQTAHGHPAHGIGELGEVGDPLLEQVPGPLAPSSISAKANSGSTCADRTRTPTPGWLPRSALAVSSPSVVCVGGIRMSTTHTRADPRAPGRATPGRLRPGRSPRTRPRPAPGTVPPGTTPRRRRPSPSSPERPTPEGRAVTRSAPPDLPVTVLRVALDSAVAAGGAPRPR